MTTMKAATGRLAGLTAIVTGGGSGFGENICHAYAAEGAQVVVADINAANGQHVVETLKAKGREAVFVQTDVGLAADMQSLVDAALRQFGKIDVMVNNAGISHANQPMLQVKEAEFDRIFRVNVKSLFHSAVSCVPVFRRQGRGCFINIGSTAAVRPRPGLAWYNGSKGAVTLLTKILGRGTRPGQHPCQQHQSRDRGNPPADHLHGRPDNSENRSKFVASIPLGRLGRSSDVANAAVFFADPASEFVTGVCLEVDGGRCI
jgi:3-oxoacyl-[acyl-carrier protein] reductase